MATGHQIVGFTSGLIAITLLPHIGILPQTPLEAILFFVFVLFGSLLPDIDTPHSKLGQKFWRLLIFVLMVAFGLYLYAPNYLNSYREELKVFVMLTLPLLIMVRSHRKMTHSIFFIGVLFIYHLIITNFFAIPYYFFIGFITGVFSHLVGDLITKRGIPIFYPFYKRHFRFLFTFRTGSSTEKMIVLTLSVWNIWFLVTQIF
ncbi:metal-dependent hydrolase [Halobacillus seohaensis]